MVRIYCLTSITRISSEENDTIQRRPYKKNAVEEWDIRENVDEQTPKNIKAQEFEFEFYQLTEICIGFDYVKNRKVYAMNIFRKDIGLLVFKMVIKNSKIRGIISAEEEAFYEAYAAKLKEFCTKETVEGVYIFPGVREAAFGIFPFDLPNPSKPNVLRQKLSVISRLIFLLCDPETGSYQNVFFEGINKIKEGKSTKNKEKDETLDQKLVCLLYNRNISDLEKFNSNNVNFETLKGVQFYNVHIFDAEEKLHRFFYANTFKALTVVELISCYITKLSDEFFRFIPGTLEHLILKRNDITFISEGIAFFTELRELNLAQNKNLFDDGIPWNCLSWRIETLNLMETNITKIPDEVKRLLSLKKLSASSLQLSVN
uniref:Uncharacterized protein n=1 Tax=Panagrolaimus superbus TaxID=310955 RepID=A0A914Z591_9BILA